MSASRMWLSASPQPAPTFPLSGAPCEAPAAAQHLGRPEQWAGFPDSCSKAEPQPQKRDLRLQLNQALEKFRPEKLEINSKELKLEGGVGVKG